MSSLHRESTDSLIYIHEHVTCSTCTYMNPLYMCTSLASWLSFITVIQHHEVLTGRHNEEESGISCP